MSLTVDISRLMSRLETMSGFNAPREGNTRFPIPRKTGKQGFLGTLFSSMGLKVAVDGAGNIRARLEGFDPGSPAVLTGSHIDPSFTEGSTTAQWEPWGPSRRSSPSRERPPPPPSSRGHGLRGRRGLQFRLHPCGSKALFGNTASLTWKSSGTRRESPWRICSGKEGTPPNHEKLPPPPRRGQGHGGTPHRAERGARIEGNSRGHRGGRGRNPGPGNTAHGSSEPCWSHPHDAPAGPPRCRRHLISRIELLAGGSGTGSTTATVGKITCFPNVSNIIPGEVRFTVDIRDVKDTGIRFVEAGIEKRLPPLPPQGESPLRWFPCPGPTPLCWTDTSPT